MLIPGLPEWFSWLVMLLGFVVTVAVSALLLYLLWYALLAVVLAVDFQVFRAKVKKAEGLKYKFKLSHFLNAWGHLYGVGLGESHTKIEIAGHRWEGFRKHIILSKFE